MSEWKELDRYEPYNRMMSVLREVEDERLRQDEKWGEQNHQPCEYMAILTEEVGESAEECLNVRFANKTTDDLRKELIQVAAVAVAFVECIDRATRVAASLTTEKQTP